MHARLKEGQKAYKNLEILLSRGKKTNLMNTIGPFQIDGNLGATAGIAEMLVQSHRRDGDGNYIIELLPAIPTEWSKGNVSGLLARGGFEIDMEWANEKVHFVRVSSSLGGTCVLVLNGETQFVKLQAGETKEITEQ